MKNYNKILEAVNRGIQLALDDFDDEEQVQNIKSKQINHRDYTKDYLDWQKLVNKLESETLSKQDIKELPRLSKLLNLKYQVNSSGKLEDIVDYIDRIDHNPNLNWIDTSKLVDMNCLFKDKTNFNGDISEWDVSNVKNMSYMFTGCRQFNQDISNWNVDKVRYTQFIF